MEITKVLPQIEHIVMVMMGNRSLDNLLGLTLGVRLKTYSCRTENKNTRLLV